MRRRAGVGLAGLFLLLAAVAQAAAPVQVEDHVRGEYRFATGPAPDFVQPQAVPAEWTVAGRAGQDDVWRNWLIDRQVDFRGGDRVDYYDNAYQALTAPGLGEAARIDISFSPLFQQLTLHRVELRRDGQWLDRLDPAKVTMARRETGFERDLADGEVTALLVLDDVRVGDVVRVSYTVRGSNPIMAGLESSRFLLGWTSPIQKRSGRLLFPAGTAVDVRRQGTDLAVRQRRQGDALEVSFEATAIPGTPDDGDAPSWYRAQPVLDVAARRDWADIVDWALPLYPPDPALPPELEESLAQWRTIEDPHARAGAVLRRVQDEVRYFGIEMGDNTHRPHAPAEVWTRRFGDCKDKAYLTATLLRRLGLDAVPALVSSRSGRQVGEMPPAATAFDHVIVRLRIGDEDFWLDPTRTLQRGDIRQLEPGGFGLALPVAAGVDALVPVESPADADNRSEVVETFVPSADGRQVELQVTARFTGERAERLRAQVHSRRLDQISDDYADYYRKRFGSLEVLQPTAFEDDEAANTVVLTERYRLAEAWAPNAGAKSLDVYAESLSGDAYLPATMERRAPLRLARPAVLRHEVKVRLPEGWVLSTLPGEVRHSAPDLGYRRVLSQDGREVSLVHELRVRDDHVAATDVREHLDAVRAVRSALSARLQFGLPVAAADEDRARRLRALIRGTPATPANEGN